MLNMLIICSQAFPKAKLKLPGQSTWRASQMMAVIPVTASIRFQIKNYEIRAIIPYWSTSLRLTEISINWVPFNQKVKALFISLRKQREILAGQGLRESNTREWRVFGASCWTCRRQLLRETRTPESRSYRGRFPHIYFVQVHSKSRSDRIGNPTWNKKEMGGQWPWNDRINRN